jgi:hypothetical protein
MCAETGDIVTGGGVGCNPGRYLVGVGRFTGWIDVRDGVTE